MNCTDWPYQLPLELAGELPRELKERNLPFCLVTVIDIVGSGPTQLGARLIYAAHGEIYGTIGGGVLEHLVIQLCQNLLSHQEGPNQVVKKSIPLSTQSGQCCGGVVEVLIETFNQGPQLFIFGSGHVGLSIARIMQGTPFKTILVDQRQEWLAQAPRCSQTFSLAPETSHDMPITPGRDYAVVLTHSHQLDLDWIKRLLPLKMKYLGLIGSQAKWQHFQKQLEGARFSLEEIRTVHCPMGLNIGGKTPQEVAISLAAEVLQIHYGKI